MTEKRIRDGQDAQMVFENPLVIKALTNVKWWLPTDFDKHNWKDERIYHQQGAALKFKQVNKYDGKWKLLEQEERR